MRPPSPQSPPPGLAALASLVLLLHRCAGLGLGLAGDAAADALPSASATAGILASYETPDDDELLEALYKYRDELAAAQTADESESEDEASEDRERRGKNKKKRWKAKKRKKKKKKGKRDREDEMDEEEEPSYQLTIGESSAGVHGSKETTSSHEFVMDPSETVRRDARMEDGRSAPREDKTTDRAGRGRPKRKRKLRKGEMTIKGKPAEDAVKLIANHLKDEFEELQAAARASEAARPDAPDQDAAAGSHHEHEEDDDEDDEGFELDDERRASKGSDTRYQRLRSAAGQRAADAEEEDHDDDLEYGKGKKMNRLEEAASFGLAKMQEKGVKGAKFDEEGRHEKGFTTRGKHDVHKKDEFHNRHEYYDEDHHGDGRADDHAHTQSLGGYRGSEHKKEVLGKARDHDSARHRGQTFERGFGSHAHAGGGQQGGQHGGQQGGHDVEMDKIQVLVRL